MKIGRPEILLAKPDGGGTEEVSSLIDREYILAMRIGVRGHFEDSPEKIVATFVHYAQEIEKRKLPEDYELLRSLRTNLSDAKYRVLNAGQEVHRKSGYKKSAQLLTADKQKIVDRAYHKIDSCGWEQYEKQRNVENPTENPNEMPKNINKAFLQYVTALKDFGDAKGEDECIRKLEECSRFILESDLPEDTILIRDINQSLKDGASRAGIMQETDVYFTRAMNKLIQHSIKLRSRQT